MKLDENEIITLDNIDSLSKAIAVGCIKSYLRYYYYEEIRKMYKNLIKDLHNEHNVNHVFSTGYDLVSEAKLLLCQNLGKKLGDEIQLKYYSATKSFSVLNGCYFNVRRIINKEAQRSVKSLPFCEETLPDEILIYDQFEELEISRDNNDWTNVNKIIAQLNLTEIEKETLECFMCGCSYSEATAMLDRSIATIFERRAKIKKKYMAVFGD